MKAAIIGVCLLLAILIFLLNQQESKPVLKDNCQKKTVPLIFSKEPRDPFLSDKMLEGYAGGDTSGAEDLKMMARFIDSVFLLVKTRDTSDYSTNEELVLFLHGNNSHRSSFLPKEGPALNGDCQLIDRWGSPLIIHPLSQKILELRSAGPDKRAYTEDDLLWPNRT